MRVSGRNGPRSKPATSASTNGRETGITTPRQTRASNGNNLVVQQPSAEKIRPHEEEDGSDSESAWSRRESARRRQITIGKARPEYRKYIQAIPIEERQPSHPSTPDPRARVSKRQFDRELGLWRRQLHEFDNVSGSTEEAESPSGASGEFLSESPGRRLDLKTAGSAERIDRPAVQTRRFTNNVALVASPEKRGDKKEPDANPPKAVISIRLADELHMGDSKPMQPPQTTPSFDPSLCHPAVWPWQMAMALPPTAECYQGLLADPSTPPKHPSVNEHGLMVDGMTPPDKPHKPSREASMWNLPASCFQGNMPDVGKENIPSFAFGADPQHQIQQTLFPYAAEACQQPTQLQQQLQWGLFAAPPLVAEAATAVAAPQAPPAPIAPQATTSTNAPSTPRKGRCNGFMSGGLSFMSPGAPSPLPALPGWAMDTPSPQRGLAALPPSIFDQRQMHQEIPPWEVLGAGLDAFPYSGYTQQHPHLAQIVETNESSHISQSPSLPDGSPRAPPVRIYEQI